MRLALALLAILLAFPATAQTQCAARESIVRLLTNDFGESQAGIGIESGGMIVELYTGITGSWTLIYTRPDGLSCAIAAGVAWESAHQAVPEPGTDG